VSMQGPTLLVGLYANSGGSPDPKNS
jgi:hypothetical protein